MSELASRPQEILAMDGSGEAVVAELLRAADEFHLEWFPDAGRPNAVQSFWFAARYPRERKLFRKLGQRFGAAVASARKLAAAAPEALLSSGIAPPSALRLAIFLDQQPRNMRAVAQEDAASLEGCIRELSQLAVQLTEGLLQASAGPATGSVTCAAVLSRCTGGTAAQICFLTLVLRHTGLHDHVRSAARLLAEMDEMEPGLEVVAAFRRRTGAALARLDAEEYVGEALRSASPELLAAEGREAAASPPRAPEGSGALACLAPGCCGGSGEVAAAAAFGAWVHDAARWAALREDPLCQELREVLLEHGLLAEGAHLVLSYSGGVDSTAHLLLLLAALAEQGVGHRGVRLSCLHLAYPNRDEEEVRGEVQWATWVCQTLGVQLYGYTIRLARPHGDEEGGLTREEYERHTKELRFRMYRCVLGGEPAGASAVVLGHHQDDVDENRLDHLQKGHVLGDVEGMRQRREIFGVPLLRPLLRRRKEDFERILAALPTPYLRDSTPSWSVRGATRTVLDGLGGERRSRVVAQLSRFGRLAAEVGAELDAGVAAWVTAGAVTIELPKAAVGLAMDLDSLLSLHVGERLAEVEAVVEAIRADWNPAAAEARPSPVAEIPENHLSDARRLLFERGFFAAAEGFLAPRRGHYHSSEGVSVNRRAVKHLYENMQECQRPLFSGGLTQELGFLHMAGPPRRILVLYDASAFPEANFKEMRGAIVAAARRALPGPAS